MNKREIINLISAIALILSIGLVSGYSVGFFQANRNKFPAIKTASDQNPGISTVKILRLEGGLLKGEVAGQKTRIAYDLENIEDIEPGQSFEIPIHQVSLGQYYTVRDLPTGTEYIASKSGKYYYSVLDPKAFKLTPKNRIYFKSSTEAEKMGLKASK